jgi:hypothetical protein
MKTDGAMRLVISPSEARSLLDYLDRRGEAFPEWAHTWDGVSSVWLDGGVK